MSTLLMDPVMEMGFRGVHGRLFPSHLREYDPFFSVSGTAALILQFIHNYCKKICNVRKGRARGNVSEGGARHIRV